MSKDILGNVIRKIVEVPKERLGVIGDMAEILSRENGEDYFKNFKEYLRQKQNSTDVSVRQILRLISGSEQLIVKGSDGKMINDGTIHWHYCGNSKEDGAADLCPPTEDIEVEVHELIQNAVYKEMFGFLSSDPKKVCLPSRRSVEEFIINHRKWLRGEGFITFIPYLSREKYFVASIGVGGGVLHAHVNPLGDVNLWNSEYRLRVVALAQLVP